MSTWASELFCSLLYLCITFEYYNFQHFAIRIENSYLFLKKKHIRQWSSSSIDHSLFCNDGCSHVNIWNCHSFPECMECFQFTLLLTADRPSVFNLISSMNYPLYAFSQLWAVRDIGSVCACPVLSHFYMNPLPDVGRFRFTILWIILSQWS